MARITPPLDSTGIFSLRLPFKALSNISYRVGAIQTFEEMIARGGDPLKLVYTPVGLTNTEYQADIVAGAAVITLLSDSQAPMYVPDTYVESYPNMAIVAHSWLVATVSCGILPDTYDTTALTTAIQRAVSDYTGVESTVTVAKAPTTDVVTQAQYVQNLAARQAAIKNRTTPYAEKLVLEAQNTKLLQAQTQYIEMIEALQARIKELEGSAPGS